MVNITELLEFTKKSGASDLHLNAEARPMLRVNGAMKKLNLPVLSAKEMHVLTSDIMTEDQQNRFEEKKEIDFSRELGNVGRFRVNAYYQNGGKAAVFRAIENEIRSFEELGLPEVVRSLSMRQKGMVLVTGPTGSGKSTTLAAMVDHINETRPYHIITIEDPIEYIHESKNSLISQREVGRDTHSFANALRSSLREDPDVILVGELRDLETIQLAITAAETGHLVLGTLHTASVAKTVARIVDVFPANQQAQIQTMFADAVEGVIAQKLVAQKDGNGRVPALEILVANTAIRSLIREKKTHQIPSTLQTHGSLGMQTMDQALKNLYTDNRIAKEVYEQYGDERV
ncbi:MAG: type IV pilus twitching motility protein PilT [Candidatus Marinimicrobia bacterium]|nr:type IV pilus twitching motility protein PilT [Candidatus Neomarinimicrobiota bacterium]MCF7830167.1 type IV pilus twitching motility protein PilT [Candidatus Neomarinimicrobiota bacterium]MCF7882099.1 type IV pilus twitching motility protein PilT [Candidatus Neomarinimicrobiota bacterium]